MLGATLGVMAVRWQGWAYGVLILAGYRAWGPGEGAGVAGPPGRRWGRAARWSWALRDEALVVSAKHCCSWAPNLGVNFFSPPRTQGARSHHRCHNDGYRKDQKQAPHHALPPLSGNPREGGLLPSIAVLLQYSPGSPAQYL